jgi:Spy/CpxP family protein refolding chaperone
MRQPSRLCQTRVAFFLGIGLVSLMPSQSGLAQAVIPSDREELLKGLGMGLASYAEGNGYPGPRHVLDLKDELGLSRDQLMRTEALEKVISSSAAVKGEEIVQAEEELNKLFASGSVSEKVLRVKLEEIGKLRADLRFIHLQAHLRTKQILTQEQLKRYNELRGHESKRQD